MQITRVAKLTADEQLQIESLVDERMGKIQSRIEKDFQKMRQDMVDSLKALIAAKDTLREMERLESRMKNDLDALDLRLQDIEQEFGW